MGIYTLTTVALVRAEGDTGICDASRMEASRLWRVTARTRRMNEHSAGKPKEERQLPIVVENDSSHEAEIAECELNGRG